MPNLTGQVDWKTFRQAVFAVIVGLTSGVGALFWECVVIVTVGYALQIHQLKDDQVIIPIILAILICCDFIWMGYLTAKLSPSKSYKLIFGIAMGIAWVAYLAALTPKIHPRIAAWVFATIVTMCAVWPCIGGVWIYKNYMDKR